MERQYVIIRDMSDGNSETGEAWQETRIYEGKCTLDQVMEWALAGSYATGTYKDYSYSKKRVQITLPVNHEIIKK